MRLLLGSDTKSGECAPVETVEEWAEGHTSPNAAGFVGLTGHEAAAEARRQRLTTRDVGVDGMNRVITADLRTNRVDLMLFDGIVVAASRPGDPRAVLRLRRPTADDSGR